MGREKKPRSVLPGRRTASGKSYALGTSLQKIEALKLARRRIRSRRAESIAQLLSSLFPPQDQTGARSNQGVATSTRRGSTAAEVVVVGPVAGRRAGKELQAADRPAVVDRSAAAGSVAGAAVIPGASARGSSRYFPADRTGSRSHSAALHPQADSGSDRR